MIDLIRVAVIDDHPLFREGLLATLTGVEGIEVVVKVLPRPTLSESRGSTLRRLCYSMYGYPAGASKLPLNWRAPIQICGSSC